MGDTNSFSRLIKLATVLVVVTYGLLVLGSTVRVHSAGLACPDWPMCFGQLVPPLNLKVGLEYFHRVIAGGVSLGFLVLGIGFLRAGIGRSRAGLLWLIAAVLLIAQVILGGLTVLELLAEWTVTSHLMVGNSFSFALFLILCHLKERSMPVDRPAIGWMTRVALVILSVFVVLQLALGGLVASSFAGLACGPTWPDCGGAGWFPTFSGVIGLQVQHRLVAYLVLASGIVAVLTAKRGSRVGRASLVVFCFILLQVCLGVMNVWFKIPMELTVFHSAGAAAIVLSLAWFHHEVWSSPLADGVKDDKSRPHPST